MANPGLGQVGTIDAATLKEKYTNVMDGIYLKKETLTKLNPISSVFNKVQFTDTACEAAVTALAAATNTLGNSLKVINNLADAAKSLVDMPMGTVRQLVDAGVDAMNTAGNAVQDMVMGAVDPVTGTVTSGVGLNKLVEAMEGVLSCPILQNTEAGATAAEILDAVDAAKSSGTFPLQLLSKLESSVQRGANEALDAIESYPIDAITNLQKSASVALERIGISSAVKNLQSLTACMNSLCSAYEGLESFVKSKPTSVEKILKSAGISQDAEGNYSCDLFQGVSTSVKQSLNDLSSKIAVIRETAGK